MASGKKKVLCKIARSWKKKDWHIPDKAFDVLKGIGVGMAAAFLFYRSVWALVLIVPAVRSEEPVIHWNMPGVMHRVICSGCMGRMRILCGSLHT